MTAWAAKCTACWDEPHWRSTVTPGTSSGRPAASHAVRAMSAGLRPDGVEAAEDDVVDGGRVDPGAGDEGLQHMGAEVRRVDGREPAPSAPHGCADRFDDVGLGHGDSSGRSVGRTAPGPYLPYACVSCVRTAIPSRTMDRYWRAISSGLCRPPGRYQDAATQTVSRTNR